MKIQNLKFKYSRSIFQPFMVYKYFRMLAWSIQSKYLLHDGEHFCSLQKKSKNILFKFYERLNISYKLDWTLYFSLNLNTFTVSALYRILHITRK